jgi:diguanylate cyclase (GGDEF)-like protein/PAS domain S-box-containing protein
MQGNILSFDSARRTERNDPGVNPALKAPLRNCLLRLAAAAVFLWACSAAAFKPPAELVVTTDENYPPYLFRSEDGRVQGIIPDKWALWSDQTGVPVRVVGTSWTSAQERVRRGEAHILEALARTPAREALYEFSPPYVITEARVFFHQSVTGVNNDVRTMQGFTVGTKAGAACGKWLSGHVALRDYPASEDLVAAAARGEVRLFCMDTPVAQYFLLKAHRAGEFRQTPPLYATSLHWATARGATELRDFVQAGFDRIPSTNLQEIEARWSGSPLAAGAWQRYGDVIILAVAAAILGGVLLLAWNRSLRARVASRTAELREALAQSDHQARRVRDLYNNAPCGYHSLNAEGIYVEVNDTELRWLGYERSEIVGKARFSDFLTADGREAFKSNFARFVESGEIRDIEYDLVRRDGSLLKALLSATMIRDAGGRLVMSRATVFDITDRNLAEQRIAHLAHHDALTGLPNRTLLIDRLQQAIAHAHRAGTRAAVLFLDLDRFKTINDSLGHGVGDRLLQAVASRIQLCVREGDTVSRLGGDEFVVVLRDIASPADAMEVAEKVAQTLSETFRVQAQDLHVSSSIGISVYPNDGADADTLLKHADTAMYHAKDAGRAQCQFFIEEMNVAMQQRLALENALRRALGAGEFRLQYQPIFDLSDLRIAGFEALLRWAPPGRAPVPPAEFITIAEESRLIIPIGDWVLREALAQAYRWQAAGRPIRIAVNVSANQLARPGFAQRVRQLIAEARIPPALVEIEITEGVIVETTGLAREAIDALADLGVGIVIDDFGTGYSGLAYLKRLPIDKVKIDQSFVRDLTIDPDNAAIITAIVAMAKSLDVGVVAEGVETSQQLHALQALGCPRGQGYHLARPMDAAQAAALLGLASERALPHAEEIG